MRISINDQGFTVGDKHVPFSDMFSVRIAGRSLFIRHGSGWLKNQVTSATFLERGEAVKFGNQVAARIDKRLGSFWAELALWCALIVVPFAVVYTIIQMPTEAATVSGGGSSAAGSSGSQSGQPSSGGSYDLETNLRNGTDKMINGKGDQMTDREKEAVEGFMKWQSEQNKD